MKLYLGWALLLAASLAAWAAILYVVVTVVQWAAS